jgi:hypothetical protein
MYSISSSKLKKPTKNKINNKIQVRRQPTIIIHQLKFISRQAENPLDCGRHFMSIEKKLRQKEKESTLNL